MIYFDNNKLEEQPELQRDYYSTVITAFRTYYIHHYHILTLFRS